MEIKIIELYLKNTNILEICRLLDLKFEIVRNAINEYLKSPYIIRESKMNYESKIIFKDD